MAHKAKWRGTLLSCCLFSLYLDKQPSFIYEKVYVILSFIIHKRVLKKSVRFKFFTMSAVCVFACHLKLLPQFGN